MAHAVVETGSIEPLLRLRNEVLPEHAGREQEKKDAETKLRWFHGMPNGVTDETASHARAEAQALQARVQELEGELQRVARLQEVIAYVEPRVRLPPPPAQLGGLRAQDHQAVGALHGQPGGPLSSRRRLRRMVFWSEPVRLGGPRRAFERGLRVESPGTIEHFVCLGTWICMEVRRRGRLGGGAGVHGMRVVWMMGKIYQEGFTNWDLEPNRSQTRHDQ